jgi:hypothetical protein
MLAFCLQATAQNDSTAFRAYLYNNEYEVFLNIDFYEESIEVPGQELYGKLPGYLGKKHNTFCWVITSAKVNGDKATISLINDYGSEDLTALLTSINDSTYTLKQLDGSALKVPKNGKWQKLPKVLELKRRSSVIFH